ncbi:MAG TPA: energy transducer TonB [Candidatus Limnocylindrales bacterium]|jgi:protein TonB|nr:energy transducer TonB [Candidatus Limnocylindrales bacterium]
MSESSVPTQSQLATSATLTGNHGHYQLQDDLARLCLPQEYKDSYRTLAWVNSICFLFLLVGMIGIKPPRVIHKPLSEIVESVPVVFTPPEEPPKVEPESKPDEPDEPQNTTEETPQVMTVIAAADPTSVAFAVPVQGAVAIAPAAHLATPPPPANHAPPQATRFNPAVADGGSYPPPQYPGVGLRNHYQGTVTIEIQVDATGKITVARVQKSSGFPALDEAALDVVKNRWRFPPGTERNYYWPCVFQLQ